MITKTEGFAQQSPNRSNIPKKTLNFLKSMDPVANTVKKSGFERTFVQTIDSSNNFGVNKSTKIANQVSNSKMPNTNLSNQPIPGSKSPFSYKVQHRSQSSSKLLELSHVSTKPGIFQLKSFQKPSNQADRIEPGFNHNVEAPSGLKASQSGPIIVHRAKAPQQFGRNSDPSKPIDNLSTEPTLSASWYSPASQPKLPIKPVIRPANQSPWSPKPSTSVPTKKVDLHTNLYTAASPQVQTSGFPRTLLTPFTAAIVHSTPTSTPASPLQMGQQPTSHDTGLQADSTPPPNLKSPTDTQLGKQEAVSPAGKSQPAHLQQAHKPLKPQPQTKPAGVRLSPSGQPLSQHRHATLSTHKSNLQQTADRSRGLSDVRNEGFGGEVAVVGRSFAGYKEGKSKINQDRWFVKMLTWRDPQIKVGDKRNFEVAITLAGVCDGHGTDGHLVSDYLARNLSGTIFEALGGLLTEYYTSLEQEQSLFLIPLERITGAMVACFQQIELKLQHQAGMNVQNSGSTCCAVLSMILKPKSNAHGSFQSQQRLFSINLGDSGAYLFTSNPSEDTSSKRYLSYHKISVEHNPTVLTEAARVMKSGGRIAPSPNAAGSGPLRVWEKYSNYPGLMMTRSFGDSHAHRIGVISIPEVQEVPQQLLERIEYIVLGSDGLWEFLQLEIVSQLLELDTFKPESVCDEIIKHAARGWIHQASDGQADMAYVDDITLIMMRYGSKSPHRSHNMSKLRPRN